VTFRKIWHVLAPIVAIGLFAGAIWVLRRELREVPLHDILRTLAAISPLRLALALALTVAGYLALTAYDLVALHHLKRKLSLGKVVYTSFIAYALANNLPAAFIVGGSVRHRLYSRWGVSAADTNALVLLNIITYALGLATAAALAFTFAPHAVPQLLKLPFHSTRPLGLIAALLVIGYLVWSSLGRPFHMKGRPIGPLPLPTTLLQIAVSLADWVISGTALYVLLPASGGLGYMDFFSVFLLGQIASLVVQLPGGIGVFEAVMVGVLGAKIPRHVVFGALLAYRVIYYLIPLAVAAILLGVHEVSRLTHKRRAAHSRA
jgi:uncharacterized membrane protein YbhN (UPF0104 family)